MRTIALASITAVLAGCTTPPHEQQWYDANLEGGPEMRQARYECLKEARVTYPGSDYSTVNVYGDQQPGTAFSDTAEGMAQGMAMASAWGRTETDEALFNACMEARGYNYHE